ncbi:Thioesterase superfamily protein [Frankia canadensis]|uniref:Acyl-coenzyme A thioesterase THEM4 n=1 Tax=Frankia canadensis TaxID=1836972 RepID=A0A2I2L0M5_9ACTN|nr:PaaI family thioesterase [Frankia canadensis]SNQ51482.1 Thioesterase superfamily protein [Frankia canadensis]SOU58772.1 Thioesterase superfamily protein [Frankia canadensis]
MTAPADADGLEAIDLPWYVLPDYQCFGCSPHNQHGLRLRFTHHGDGLRTTFRLGRPYESYPGVVHGGLLGVIADEIMGNLIVLRTGQIPFTTGMRLRYVHPVAVGGDYECVARVRDDSTGTLLHAESDIRTRDGEVVATATASYRTVSLDAARGRVALDEPEVDDLHRALAAATTASASTSAAPVSTRTVAGTTVVAGEPTEITVEDSHARVD